MDTQNIKTIDAWLTDMDGVLVHQNTALPGAAEFVETLKASGKPFLVLTGISTMETIEQFPFRPSTVVNGIADLIPVAQTGQI